MHIGENEKFDEGDETVKRVPTKEQSSSCCFSHPFAGCGVCDMSGETARLCGASDG